MRIMKKTNFFLKLSVLCFACLTVLACASSALAGVEVFVINTDGPGEGFNDPTPAAPVGGNPGTTKGAQRLYAFQFAANKWGATLDSNQAVYVVASFDPLGPNVLGQAGPWDVFSDFSGVGLHPGAQFAATWYYSALADKRAGQDQDGTAPDIFAQFSSDFDFYLGTDNNHGAKNDLVAVLLHELGHGLGFSNQVNESTGTELGGFTDAGRFYPVQPDVFERQMLDITTGKHWHEMTVQERKDSGVRFGRVVWDGATVTADVPQLLVFGSPEVKGNSPTSVAKPYQFGTAAFGPQISSLSGQVTANVVAAQDVAEPAAPPLAAGTTTDGCSPFTNAAAINGNIALVERGLCGFAVKARNAFNAGAVAVIIYNQAANANAAPPNMADDGVPFTYAGPTIGLTRADGLGFNAVSPNGNASIGPNFAIRAGADAMGRARLYMPNPVVGGSSGSHYDSIAVRNLLMEPSINGDLTHEVTAPNDLTLELLRDIGWFPDADVDGEADSTDCEPHSNLSPTVIIGGCNTGVPNIMFTTAPNRGCTLADRIAHIAADSNKNHGTFVKNANALLNDLKKSGAITAAQKDALANCIGQSTNP
jgi:PA domain-containing protein